MGDTHVRDRLAASLGVAYTLGRELGDGGASRVFLAHDASLGRDVIVKVLAYALPEGLSCERFAREIRVAARLQHPHIVPLLSAGTTADGLPFYTMPFVRGESLRARLTRGRLAVDDGVGILRDVLRALAYAHAHGVVHRDIKPDNVLLSSDTALVIDFGIAKALQASMVGLRADADGDGTVTRAGTSHGTPAYMAPEQAAGDPAADHRVDLYAWGVVAYEVLAGRHPFAGWTSPRQLLAAHMAVMPVPLDAVVGDVTPALAAVVTWCLAKDPGERPASANAVLRALDDALDDAMLGAAVPSRAVMGRAFALYAVAVVAVTFLAHAAIRALGLPDWVLSGAILVMALGLPVLIATGYEYRRRHRRPHRRSRRPTRRQTSSLIGMLVVRVRRLLTWRRAAWGGVFAVAAFGLVVAGYMAMRALGIGPAASLLAAGTLAPGERLLVADFDVARVDSGLGTAAAAVVRTVVAGDLTRDGRGYLVGLRLMTAATGDTVATFRASAARGRRDPDGRPPDA